MSNTIVKDPDAPKKPRNSFLRFSANERPKLKAQGINDFSEMSKALSNAWHEIDQGTKVRYEKEYEQDKQNYEKKLTEYKDKKNKATSEHASNKKRSTKKIDENVNLHEKIKENMVNNYQQRQEEKTLSEVTITIKICTDQVTDVSVEEPKTIKG